MSDIIDFVRHLRAEFKEAFLISDDGEEEMSAQHIAKWIDDRLHAESSPWIKIEDHGVPQKDGYYVLRIQQIDGDEWFFTTASRIAGVWDTIIDTQNWTHYQPIDIPE